MEFKKFLMGVFCGISKIKKNIRDVKGEPSPFTLCPYCALSIVLSVVKSETSHLVKIFFSRT